MKRLSIILSFSLLCSIPCLSQSNLEDLKQEYNEVKNNLAEKREIQARNYESYAQSLREYEFLKNHVAIEKKELKDFAKGYKNESVLKGLREALGSPYNSATISQVISLANDTKKEMTDSQKTEAESLINLLGNYKGNIELLKGIINTLSNSNNLSTLRKNNQSDLRWKQIDKVFKEKATDIQKIESIRYLQKLLEPLKKHTGNPFIQFDEMKTTVEKMK